MLNFFTAFAVGTVLGVLSGFGVGGGSLLLVWLTGVVGMEQQQAQGVNLLYFLPAALAALPAHRKNGFVDREVSRPAILAGLVCAALAAWIATGLDTALLKKCFGLFLLWVGLRELLRKPS